MTDDFLIHELGPMGDGVHQSQRGRIFVDRALPGDRVRAGVQKGTGGVLRADAMQVVEASPHRIKAPCPNYDVCGGCSLQHADGAFYRRWKVETVRSALDRHGLEPAAWLEPVFLPAGHRRRVTFAAYKKKGRVTLGYFRRRSHNVTDIAVCLTADPAIMALRTKLVTSLASILQDGKTADIFIQRICGQIEIAITGPLGKKGRPDLQVHEAVADLAHTAGISRISWRLRERDSAEVLLEINPLYAKFGALNVALPPLAFLQPTEAGERALVDAVMELLPSAGTFADLFSGCGTFSGPMLNRGPVDAYDGVGAAIAALDKSKGVQPLKAMQRDLFRNPLLSEEAGRYDAIVFDPPRAGAHEQARALASGRPPIVIGVSCNPATFARDARTLVDGGYELKTVKIVDQFTWTHHVELVASFTRS
jgi:23S rRNA (uracil1939-C5)-methyltransferase